MAENRVFYGVSLPTSSWESLENAYISHNFVCCNCPLPFGKASASRCPLGTSQRSSFLFVLASADESFHPTHHPRHTLHCAASLQDWICPMVPNKEHHLESLTQSSINHTPRMGCDTVHNFQTYTNFYWNSYIYIYNFHICNMIIYMNIVSTLDSRMF